MGFTATLESMTLMVSTTGILPAIDTTATVTFTNMIHTGARLGIDDETEAIGGSDALSIVSGSDNRIVFNVGALAALLDGTIDATTDVPTGDENAALRESVAAFKGKLTIAEDDFLDVDRSAGQTVVARLRLGDQILFRTRPLSVQACTASNMTGCVDVRAFEVTVPLNSL